MTYQGYDNLSVLVFNKAGQITSLGFDVIRFISDHTLGVAVLGIILVILYNIFVRPILEAQRKLEEEE